MYKAIRLSIAGPYGQSVPRVLANFQRACTRETDFMGEKVYNCCTVRSSVSLINLRFGGGFR